MTPTPLLPTSPPRWLGAFLALAAASSLAGDAAAYCRSSTCPPDPEIGSQGAQCNPHEDTDCGVPLRWERDCFGFVVQQDASKEITLDLARKTIAKAFKTWESADCGAGGPGIHGVDMGTVECDQVEYEPRAANANILLFRDEEWQENGYDKLALTTVNFDKETGEIWNADIEVNTHDYDFVQGEGGGDYDFQGVLTHEAGHFLGLAHTPDPEATMLSFYHDQMVDLAEDDVIGICASYPPKKIDTARCNPIPRHGFSPRCANEQTEGQCAVPSPERSPTPGDVPALPIAAAIGLLALRRRRRPPAPGPSSLLRKGDDDTARTAPRGGHHV